MIVTLTWHEFSLAATAGARRNILARQKNLPMTYGAGVIDAWGLHIEGAAAEMAVAKALGEYWDPVWDEIDRSRGDIGAALQVRSTARDNGCLILHPRDDDFHRFVLVTGIAPTFTVRGWILAADGKQDEFWREDVRAPAWFVPQSALTPGLPT